jgi:hypothetical protein
MKVSLSDFEKILKVLTAAYHARQPKELDEGWQADVMNHIKRLGPPEIDAGSLVFSTAFMWRFVTVACILIAILSLVLMNGVSEPEFELTKLFLNDPVGYAATQMWGV